MQRNGVIVCQRKENTSTSNQDNNRDTVESVDIPRDNLQVDNQAVIIEAEHNRGHIGLQDRLQVAPSDSYLEPTRPDEGYTDVQVYSYVY